MKQELKMIGRIQTDFPTKFGLPRQGNFAKSLTGQIIMEPEYRKAAAFKGIEEYSHLWLLWGFSEVKRTTWVPTVKPPRLGGKIHKGVFATRSPFRPNPIGLTCVRLEEIRWETPEGPVLVVSGIDMMNGSPIYDIKPYLSYADAWPEARSGFGEKVKDRVLEVEFPDELLMSLDKKKREGAIEMLRQDPRPPYHNHAEQVYKIAFADVDIHFTVEDNKLTVCRVIPLGKSSGFLRGKR